jgi:hypothetical protein
MQQELEALQGSIAGLETKEVARCLAYFSAAVSYVQIVYDSGCAVPVRMEGNPYSLSQVSLQPSDVCTFRERFAMSAVLARCCRTRVYIA